MFSTFEIVLFAFVAFIFVYAVVDRICRCVEHRDEYREVTKAKEENVDKYIL